MRTTIDWSKHELHITKNEHIAVWHLRIDNSYLRSVKFINVEGRLLVTGDWGN